MPGRKHGRSARLVICYMAMFFCITSATAAMAQSHKAIAHKSILEKIEWTWAAQPDNPNPALPNVLLLGDSITRGYYPEVAKLLAGRANCYLFATSAASGDPRLIHQVGDYFAMMPIKFAVVHFNNGMHDGSTPNRPTAAPFLNWLRRCGQNLTEQN